MGKMRTACPECGHRYTVNTPTVQAMHVGVRARRITGNQFEYTLTLPSQVSEDTRFATVADDLKFYGALAAAVGTLFGGLVSAFAPEYALHAVLVGASVGVTVTWGWLCDEHNQRLKRVVPWFVSQRHLWRRPEMGENGEVTLVVDHLHRDSYSEQGRSVALLGVLPVDIARFRDWAEAAIRGDNLAIAHWVGSGNLFSRGEYDQLLDKMRAANIVAKSGKGHVLTNPGRHALRRILADTSPALTKERV